MNKNYFQPKQHSCLAALSPAASPETNHSPLTTHHSLKRKSAFTLAEVLITLAIIGIVAALTLPTLVQNYKEKVLIVKVKRTYSNIQNATILAQKDNGSIGDNSVLFNAADGVNKVAVNFAKYFSGAKVCKFRSECPNFYYDIEYATSVYKADGSRAKYNPSNPKIILNDGSILWVAGLNSGCETHRMDTYYDENGQPYLVAVNKYYCTDIYFDVNGPRLPNKFGEDAFLLIVYKDRVAASSWSTSGGNTLKNILSGNEKLHSGQK